MNEITTETFWKRMNERERRQQVYKLHETAFRLRWDDLSLEEQAEVEATLDRFMKRK